jgi:hypothetical protein
MESASKNEMSEFHIRSPNVHKEKSLCEVHHGLTQMDRTKYQANLAFSERIARKILNNESKENAIVDE